MLVDKDQHVVLPASAGMIPARLLCLASLYRAPRKRGDDPA